VLLAKWTSPVNLLLYLILDSAICDPVAVARAVAPHGVDFIQLRDFRSNDAEYAATARQIMDAMVPHGTRFIVSERPHLVQRLGAHGVHIGERYRDIQTAREEIGAGPILGVSQFTPEFIADNLGEDFPVDYLSVGPVWSTVSKADAGAEIGVAEATRIAAANPYATAFIGGINASNAGQILETNRGLSSSINPPMLVVLGSVCRSEDPARAVAELQALLSA
jgi:thiamine-phosphate pyrophosphorylase